MRPSILAATGYSDLPPMWAYDALAGLFYAGGVAVFVVFGVLVVVMARRN